MEQKRFFSFIASYFILTLFLTSCLTTGDALDILRQTTDVNKTTTEQREDNADYSRGGTTSSTQQSQQYDRYSAMPISYKNMTRHFSFAIPGNWSQQSGDVNSNSALFMLLEKTCSFQFNYTQMVPSFPAESSVQASLRQAYEEITIGKLLSAKRRDEYGMQNGSRIQFTRGWEIVENGPPGGHQRIIYQAYDGMNYYYNFMAASETQNFRYCEPMLREIINSIRFGD
jgi:hypothetical protein